MYTAEGIVNGEWYGLADPNDGTKNIEDFDICAAYHAGWNQRADGSNLFRRLNYLPGMSGLCDLESFASSILSMD